MLIQALTWLLALPSPAATSYANLIKRYGHGLDPLLVVAVIYRESRGRKHAISHTNDYGLLQLHVSDTTNTRYRGSERLLLDPARNIRIGTRMLRAWKRYHDKHCKGLKHRWWGHYNQGGRVRSRRYGIKVLSTFDMLVSKFRAGII